MRGQTLWKLAVETLPEAEDAVGEMLQRVCGQTVTSYTDVETGRTSVDVYLSGRPNWAPALKSELAAELRKIGECGLNLGRSKISLRKVPAQDWAESWKRHFRPQDIGSSLLVKPSWSRRKARPGQLTVVLDPGLSFGTGQHPTTAFCLEQLVRAAAASRSFLDVGTGSGILAISAARLGYRPVHAFDYDPESIRVAKANAEQNGVEKLVKFSRKDVRRLRPGGARKYSVVCANLISSLLLEERDRILACVAPDGLLVLAGILAKEFREVRQAYEQAGLALIKSRKQGEWQSGSFAFRPQ